MGRANLGTASLLGRSRVRPHAQYKQFVSTEHSSKKPDVSNEDEWSACSGSDFSDDGSESESFDERVDVGAIKSQRQCKRFPEAFNAATEDFPQMFIQTSAIPANQTAEL